MAPNNSIHTPGTPSRRDIYLSAEFDGKIGALCAVWPLGLEPKQDYSPSKNQGTIEDECLRRMRFCFYKKLLDGAFKKFESCANNLYSGWVTKPRADRGVLPLATRTTKPISEEERQELLRCLLNILRELQEAHLGHGPSAEAKSTRKSPATSSVEAIPFALTPRQGIETGRNSESETSVEGKRSRTEPFPDVESSKRSKAHTETAFYGMPPPPNNMQRYDSRSFSSVNTSFAPSEASTIFSKPSFSHANSTSTQETIPDDDELPIQKLQDTDPEFTTIREDKTKSSDYGASSSFERALDVSFDGEVLAEANQQASQMDQELSQDILGFGLQEHTLSDPRELAFRTELEDLFPGFPACLKPASIYVAYEITRVFLHTGANLLDLDAPITDALNDYDTLWKFLKHLPVLDGLPFPERCGADTWKFAIEGSRRGGNSIVLGGSLNFGTASDPSFRLLLDPLKIDQSHRLDRRLGHDRFLEICMPSLKDNKIAKSVSRLGDRGIKIFYDWLVDTEHCILGRKWKPFFNKDKERKKSKKQDIIKEVEANITCRVYFYAIDGHDFLRDESVALRSPDGKHSLMSVESLLNMVRPTNKNTKESYLKLFSRTSLALSRNQAVICLQPDVIRFVGKNVIWKGDVMNDGAGRISARLALEVTLKLGLDFIPSAFQGRLGEAKGLWIVDSVHDHTEKWIEIYPSQQKWERDTKDDQSGISDDESHRTLEILKWSGTLKSAELNNQFLPLLVQQSNDTSKMKLSLVNILKEGLANEVTEFREATDNAQLLRKWVRKSKPSTKDRIKHEGVPWRSGLPIATEEQVNLLLDAGFTPRKNKFVHDQVKKLFDNRSEDLEMKMKITVSSSTYALMVPDFDGVLDEGEVYIDLSGFVDNVTGLSGTVLKDIDLLVARSPAHFISDIQKVRLIVKPELMGLKNVIVFPTKGKPNLAEKLSGGDYDGDIAWICWEQSIVNNFTTAPVQEVMDLVAKGFVRRDTTTYEDLVKGCLEPTSTFLKNALEFSMRPDLLGICTNFKEKVCYTLRDVDTQETRILSQLLSLLVDAPKQGYIFEEQDWRKLKDVHVRTRPRNPQYMEKDMHNATDHILDYLRVVAKKTLEKSREQVWKGVKEAPTCDEHIPIMYEQAKKFAMEHKEWDELLQLMIQQLEAIKLKWKEYWDVNDKIKVVRLANFHTMVTGLYEEFHAITPAVNTALTKSLLFYPGIGGSDQLSQWSLLKASTLFGLYKRHVSACVWWIAGRQLLELKARATGTGLPHIVVPHMYAILRPDNTMIGRLTSEMNENMFEESASVRNVDDLEAWEDE